MAGVVSLNGQFSYPIEVLKTLTVDEKSTFKKSVAIGNGNTGANKIAFSFGDNSNADADYSTAIGYGTKAKSKYSIAAGHETEVTDSAQSSIAVGTSAKANNKNAFIWSGVHNSTKYTTQGDGTFCIKPSGGADGMFIDKKSLPEIIKDYALKYVQENANTFVKKNTFEDSVTINGGLSVSRGKFVTDSGIVSEFNGDVTVPDVPEGDSSKLSANTKFVHANVDKCIKLTGGEMTGDLILNRDPVVRMQAATMGYVDEKIVDTISKCVVVDNSKRPNGTEIASVRVNETVTKLYAPKIVAGQHIVVTQNEKEGSITVGMNPDVSFVGGSIRVPVGTIVSFVGSNTPDGFMHCDGRELSRSEFNELYSAIGLTFTKGLTFNTFNIPKIDDGRILSGHTQNGHERVLTYDDSGTSSMNVFGMRYYIKYKTVATDNPVLSVNSRRPDDNGNVDVDFSFKPKSETWTFKKMSGEEYTRKVLIGD